MPAIGKAFFLSGMVASESDRGSRSLIAALQRAPATSVAKGKRPYKSIRIPETCASADN